MVEDYPTIYDATIKGRNMQKEDLNIYGRYNWKGQLDRLMYVGTRHYRGDPRTWYQFELVSEPGKVWCEVLESDLSHFEETKTESDEEKKIVISGVLVDLLESKS